MLCGQITFWDYKQKYVKRSPIGVFTAINLSIFLQKSENCSQRVKFPSFWVIFTQTKKLWLFWGGFVKTKPGGYLVERWVRGCVAQIGCFFGLSGFAMAHFLFENWFRYIGHVFAKCIISDEFVLWFIYRLSKSTYASQFTL